MNFKVVGFKMPRELSDRIDECVAHLGVQRTTWVREVIADALKREGFPIDPALLKPNQGARNDLPNRVTEAEKRARKGLRPRGRPRKSELVVIENLEKRARKEFAALARAFGKTPAEAKALAEAALPRGKAVREARKPAAAPAQAPRSRRAA